jgi:diguanylate cyclase (GGDEF)-like protein
VTGGPDTRYGAPLQAALPGVCALLSLVFATYAVLHMLTLGGSARVALSVAAAVAAAALAALATTAWRRGLTDNAVNPTAAGLVVVVGLHAVAVMVMTDQPGRTADVLLAVVGAGALLTPVPWFAGTLYVVWGAWVAGAVSVGPRPDWPAYGMAMATATVLAGALNVAHRRLLDALGTARDLAEAVAVRDPLTGLANRRGLQMLAAPIVETARRQGDAVHAVFLDVEGLGAVNGRHGHAAGDEVLLSVAEALTGVIRATDVIARWGGDKFVVVGPGPGMTPIELERRVRDRLVTQPTAGTGWRPSLSAGGAMLAPWDSGTLDSLLQNADRELHLRRSLRRDPRQDAPTPTE